jgi:hypothetical protein
VDLVDRARLAILGELLQLGLDLVQHVEVEQVAQLAAADQLAQQVAVEGQRLRLALGERRVAFVEERGDVVEHQRARERRRQLGDRRLEPDRARSDLAQLCALRDRPFGIGQVVARPGGPVARDRRGNFAPWPKFRRANDAPG